MPIIKSAKKRMKQTAAARARNQNTKRSLRAEIKIFMATIAAKDSKKAAEQLKKVQSQLDKAVKKNVLKKNTAARKLAQLTEKANALGAKPFEKSQGTATATKAKATPTKKTASKTTKPAAKKAAPKKTPVKK